MLFLLSDNRNRNICTQKQLYWELAAIGDHRESVRGIEQRFIQLQQLGCACPAPYHMLAVMCSFVVFQMKEEEEKRKFCYSKCLSISVWIYRFHT